MTEAPQPSGILIPERPRFPFLIESQAGAEKLPPLPGQPACIGYHIRLDFIDSPALKGRGFALNWRQGANPGTVAKVLREIAQAMDDYEAEISAREAQTAQPANDDAPGQATPEPGKNGAEQALPAAGERH